MNIRFKVQTTLKWTSIVELNPILLNRKAAADFTQLVQKGDHISVSSPFHENASFRADRCHTKRGRLNTVWKHCVLHIVEFTCPLNANGTIHVQSNVRAQFL